VLRPLEASLTTAPPPDPERERTYQLAEILDAQLQRMSDDLREVIEHLNTANRSQQDESDPVVQIGKVLNAHMDSLQWIDQTSAQVQRKVEDVAKMHEVRARENERGAAGLN
jgi:nuclear pore complex protein Nup62